MSPFANLVKLVHYFGFANNRHRECGDCECIDGLVYSVTGGKLCKKHSRYDLKLHCGKFSNSDYDTFSSSNANSKQSKCGTARIFQSSCISYAIKTKCKNADEACHNCRCGMYLKLYCKHVAEDGIGKLQGSYGTLPFLLMKLIWRPRSPKPKFWLRACHCIRI